MSQIEGRNRELVRIQGATGNRISMRWASGAQAQATVDIAGVNVVNIAPSNYATAGVLYKRAVSANAAASFQAINGDIFTGAAPGSMPSVGPFALEIAIGGFHGGHIRRIAYWPRAMSAAELQALTYNP